MMQRLFTLIRECLVEMFAITRNRHSVRGKVTGVILTTTAIALLVAGVAMLRHDLSVYRQSWAADLTTEANILALSTAPALAFDDHKVAEHTLGALSARPAVLGAALYDTGGRLYAGYAREGEPQPPARVPDLRQGAQVSGERVEVMQRIVRGDEMLGTIYLRARYDVYGRVRAYLGIFGLVMLMSMVVALILSTALRKVITAPLEEMAGVAREVGERRDYSLRARRISRDEIGVVIQAFNNMLDEVQSRTRALEQSNAALRESERRYRASEEALRETDRRKDEFLATLAHELRNPLAPIRHAVKLLELDSLDEEQRGWSRDVISRQVQRMALLLDDLLDVSRITRGRLQLRKDYVDLTSLVNSAVETARPLIEAKEHQLQIRLPAQAVELEVDPLRLSQALSNLLTNAAKYTDTGGRIELTAAIDGAGLIVSVRDNGIGLSPMAIPKLFEMFSQVDSAIDRAEGGLGIGLALVKGLVGLHGGTVEASSAGLGHGSEFTIRVPRAVAEPRPAAANAAGVSGALAPAHPRCKVLLADDNRDAAVSMAALLQHSGYEVFVAYSGMQALQIGAREHPAVIILDIGMPGMTGYETARRIRQEAWGHRALLLAVTGWGQEDDKEKARSAGFDHHLTKPVDPDRIEQLILSRIG